MQCQRLEKVLPSGANLRRFASSFPAAKPVAQSADTAALAQNFADIADGKVIVRCFVDYA